MVSAWPSIPFTFRALRKTFGTMWLRCDACRRYAPLRLAGLMLGLGETFEEVVDTLRSGWVTTGPKAKRFEAAFT